MTNNLADEFNKAMFSLYQQTKTQTSYNPKTFHNMLIEHGGVKTAQILLGKAQPSEGYTTLYELHRLDLTIEAFIWDNPKFHELFSPDELNIAKKRLIDYCYIN